MSKIVFLGDSVTDCSRKRAIRYDSTLQGLGKGWVSHVYKTLKARESSVEIWNRGYSGSLIHELSHQENWWPMLNTKEIHSDISTIMIGINDVWHPFWKGTDHQIEQALIEFEQLVETIKLRSNNVLIVEPLALPIGDVNQNWWPVIEQLTSGQQRAATTLGVQWLPLQDVLLKDAHVNFADYLADGVHPTPLGHVWIAKKWLNAVNELGWVH